MRISQNSSAFCEMCSASSRLNQIRECREGKREAFGARRCPLRANSESPCWATLKRRRQIPSSRAAASALLTKLQLCRCPAFAKHQDANVERFVAATRQARPAEQQPIIAIRSVAQRNPSQIARNFEATALSGQP